MQNDILWFWPNSDPQYKDILVKKNPPYIPELDDPSYTKLISNRDLPYGYGEPDCHFLLICILFDLGQSSYRGIMKEAITNVVELCSFSHFPFLFPPKENRIIDFKLRKFYLTKRS